MAQMRLERGVGSGHDSKSRAIQRRTTSKWVPNHIWPTEMLLLSVVQPTHLCVFSESQTQTTALIGKVMAELVLDSLWVSHTTLHYPLVILLLSSNATANYLRLRMPFSFLLLFIALVVVLGTCWVTGKQPRGTERALDSMKENQATRPHLPLTSCETPEVRHGTFLCFSFLVYKKESYMHVIKFCQKIE